MSVFVGALTSPYKGLAAFEDSELDALLFFGRERESEVIAANLMAARITVLYGPSGVGKSSVLRAGVAHRLRREHDVEVLIFSSWTGDPVGGLVEAAGGAHGESLADAFADAAARAGGDLYVILDQFEEFFLYHPDGGRFASQLAEILRRPGLRVHVLIGMREDSLARLDALKAAIPNLLANRLRLERLDRAAGEAAILGPIHRYNELEPAGEPAEVEPALVGDVLDQVTAGRVELGVAGRGVAAAVDEGRIEAPYLQLVLARLWEVETERGSRVLRQSTFQELGGAERIVQDHLERAMDALTPREQGAAAAMYNFLVTPSGTKIAHGVRDLAGYASVDEREAALVLQRLSSDRIVRASSENGPSTTRYEIFHDVLAGAVVDWRNRFESQRALADERERHQRRQRRLVAIGAAALLGVAVMAAIAIYALAQRSEAQHQAEAAHTQQVKAEQSAETANAALTREAEAKKTAQKNEQNAQQSEQKYRQAAAHAQAEEQRASNSAEAERRARRRAEAAEAGLQVEAQNLRRQRRRANRETRKVRRAQIILIKQRNNIRAHKLEADARLLLTEDAEKSVRRSLAALRAYRTAKIPPSDRVQDTLREGLIRLRVRAVLPGLGRQPVRVVRFSPDDSLAFVGGRGGAVLYDLKHGFKARQLLPSSTIWDAAFSPDGTLVVGAGAGRDRVAHVWDVRTGAEVLTLEHTGAVLSVAFSPNGQLIATGSEDGTARIWSVATGLQLDSFAHQKGARGDDVQQVAFSPDGARLLTVGGNRLARVFDVFRHAELFALNNVSLVNKARFSHDGSMIATVGAIEAVRVWNARTGALIDTLDLTGSAVDVAFSPNDSLLATAGSNDTVGRIWDLAKGSSVATITVHRSGLQSIIFTPNGSSVITTGRDGKATIAGIVAGNTQASLGGHRGPVGGASLTRDGSLVATWSDDGTARLWDARTTTGAREIGKHDSPSASKGGPVVAFSADGRYMLSGGADGVRLEGPRGAVRVLAHGLAVTSAAFSGTGRRLITGTNDGTARVWRVSDGQLIASLRHGAAVTAARLTPDGRFAVTAGQDGFVRIWNVASGSQMRSYQESGAINDAEMSRDGTLVAVGSSNGITGIFGVTADRALMLRGHSDSVNAVAFSPDGKRVATGSADGTARLWDARSGTNIELTGHTGGVNAVAFNRDGSRLATASVDADIRIWNGKTGTPITVLRGHSGSVTDVMFSSDGRWLATAGPLAAGIWETRKGANWPGSPLYFVRAASQGRLDHLAFSPKGWRLLTGWRSGSVRLFDCRLCGGVKELRSIANVRLREIVAAKP